MSNEYSREEFERDRMGQTGEDNGEKFRTKPADPIIKTPVRYDAEGERIEYLNGKTVADLYANNEMGEYIAKCINEYSPAPSGKGTVKQRLQRQVRELESLNSELEKEVEPLRQAVNLALGWIERAPEDCFGYNTTQDGYPFRDEVADALRFALKEKP